ncbi:hypothetical protein SLS56_001738 [Neofusicoccum ribis]|uniref:Allantoate permease n=1 Tax=Neofusicoccum ribis TaxID=45134 RepID=A0ABR3T6Z4_9PEZI
MAHTIPESKDTAGRPDNIERKGPSSITEHPHGFKKDDVQVVRSHTFLLIGYKEYLEALDIDVSEREARIVRWKIDSIILPTFLITQALQFMDKTALNYANLFGYQKALGLHGQQFNYLSAIVYAGYFFGQYPCGWLIGRLPAQKVMAVSVLCWGVTVIILTQCRSYSSAMAVRFWFMLPDSPANAWFLKQRERLVAVKRVSTNETGIKNKAFDKKQILVAFRDPKAILLFISVFAAAIPNGVVNSFSTIIIRDMGFATTKTTELKSVGDATQIVALFIGGAITLNIRNSYCWGNFAGPFVVKNSQAPYYEGASIGLLVGYSIKAGCHILLLENRRRDRTYGPANKEESDEAGMLDHTEFENKNFRYVL